MTRFGRLTPAVSLFVLCAAARVLGQAPSDTTHAGEPPRVAPPESTSSAPPSIPETTHVVIPETTHVVVPETTRVAVPPSLDASINPLLLQPRSEEMMAKAPGEFKVRFQTSKGDFIVEVHRDWMPMGADRFYNLVKAGYYDDTRFFRVIPGFMAQFGINGHPQVNQAWREASIADEPTKKSNTRGRVSFAKRGLPNTRTTQLFINYANNSRLDDIGFGALGEVVKGMNVVDALYSGYGECKAPDRPEANGPEQARIQDEGNAYLVAGFPKLDYIVKATIIK
jgi:peptidyl-prolyl cis-trans isomerase A (cyclophilin A)